ncbi:hypothetical protein PVL30_005644 [Lodderomyces elongisporus]|uniref:uncharacterized protein n=1 Tax=Lodderomyces elongisporus TaxID=36914 RepID=UPI00291E9775|nr:uncharacterized protein PVL30_005644 [Lodderomyces elongisporus]WLF81843.1 hypothetical protein PVL30_005644 [Lodderomyces elongisporus]
MSSTLKLKQYPVDTSREAIFNDSVALLKKIPQWNEGKTFYKSSNYPVYSKHNEVDGDFWCSRETVLKNINVERLRKAIIGTTEQGFTHSDYEPHYVHEISEMQVRNLQQYKDGWSYTIHAQYNFGFPLSKRTFNELIHIYIDAAKQWALIVSLPIKGALYEHSVLGEYVSLEELKWNDNNDSAEWLVATTSTAGGNVPDWATKWSLAGALAKDVPNVVDLIASKDYFDVGESEILTLPTGN